MVLVLPGLRRVPGIALEVITRGAMGCFRYGTEEGMVADCKGLYRCAGWALD